ncbi:MAG: hypothetical protein ACR2HZ_06900 [Gemmatimonadaceae bacterium]
MRDLSNASSRGGLTVLAADERAYRDNAEPTEVELMGYVTMFDALKMHLDPVKMHE